MATRNYKIDFYQIVLTPTGEMQKPADGFKKLIDDKLEVSRDDGLFTREIFGLKPRNNGASIGFQFRKFRTDDLPEIGCLGQAAEAIELDANEGLIEQNCIVWYRRHNILTWHVNMHANHPVRLAEFLSEVWGTRVQIEPIIRPDAIRRLLRGDMEVQKVDVTVAAPSNPDLFPDDTFSKELLTVMNSAGVDSFKLHMGVDLRANKSASLSGVTKQFIQSMRALGATTAKAIAKDGEGITHTIDLIADRLSHSIPTEASSKLPTPDTMYALMDRAYQEHQETLNEYFGQN